ncbi:alkaline phosphatase [Roseimaritima sediminicola]|uniref:alkaline phosphatase n=1 Tax=Roseimaritima sediminicola TaxID=2662066 RepID=UPI001298282A|nr:alkaline phosphatase [Roseimaritima sediminicola]
MPRYCLSFVALSTFSLGMLVAAATASEPRVDPQAETDKPDPMRQLQTAAMEDGQGAFGHWGAISEQYSSWTNHSNRLIPMYTFGIDLDTLREEGSAYADEARLKQLYGKVPEGTLNPEAKYFDQTDVYRLQLQAVEAGKRHVILVVFDGMDWQTTRAASLYKQGAVQYDSGRGTGLLFQDYRGGPTDFGFFVTSPLLGGLETDVNVQVVLGGDKPSTGGYDPSLGGSTPWQRPASPQYPIGLDRTRPHTVTDSASSATSLTAGIKTYNASINVAADGEQVEPIARKLQRKRGFAVGAVSSVPVSHATMGATYANNVSRGDYQDISRDLLGVRSVAHRSEALPGVDVLLGGGWGEEAETAKGQGENYLPGNKYIHQTDLDQVESNGAVVVQRTPGRAGDEVLSEAAAKAAAEKRRLVGVFGTKRGHLPFQTADGQYNPTVDMKGGETYTAADVQENPTLADMTTAALQVLEQNEEGFWLLVEAGDVDWANHANNLDDSIGAVLSGDAAFAAIVRWVEQRQGWDDTAVILTADHGHYFIMTDPQAIADAGKK